MYVFLNVHALGCCIVSCVLLLLLLMMSFSSLDYNEYGLDYNAITLNVGAMPPVYFP